MPEGDTVHKVAGALRRRMVGVDAVGKHMPVELAGEVDQGAVVARGIGKVYTSEVLFLRRIHPATPTEATADRALAALHAEARSLLVANLEGGPRRTAGGRTAPLPQLWVYGRHRRPCLRRGAPIERRRRGRGRRTTYWCARCQRRGAPIRQELSE